MKSMLAMLKALFVYATILIVQMLTNGGVRPDKMSVATSLIIFVLYLLLHDDADRDGGR